jgi:hypothetical protein
MWVGVSKVRDKSAIFSPQGVTAPPLHASDRGTIFFMSFTRPLHDVLRAGALLFAIVSCSSAPQEAALSRGAVAPRAWSQAAAPNDDDSGAARSLESTPSLASHFEERRFAALSSAPRRPAPRACQAPCQNCRLLYDEQQAKPSEGRKLSENELALVRRGYADYLSGPECRSMGLAPTKVGSAEDIGQVFDVLDGTFTERGRRETLVLFFAGACGLAAPDAPKVRIFMLLRDGELLESFTNDEGFASFDRLLDVDGDSVHEVVVVGGWAGKGGLASWISLRSFAGRRDRDLGFFNTLESGCGWSAADYWSTSVDYGVEGSDRALCFVERKATLRCPSLLVSDK